MFQPVNDYLPEAKGDFRDNIVHGYPAAVSLALFDFFDRAEHIVVGTGIQLVPGSYAQATCKELRTLPGLLPVMRRNQ